jgi:hypothetical protein
VIAQDHILVSLLPEALPKTAGADTYEVTLGDAMFLIGGGVLFHPDVSRGGMHLAVQLDRLAKFFFDLDETGTQWTPIPGNKVTAMPKAAERIAADLSLLPEDKRGILPADVQYDDDANERTELRFWRFRQTFRQRYGRSAASAAATFPSQMWLLAVATTLAISFRASRPGSVEGRAAWRLRCLHHRGRRATRPLPPRAASGEVARSQGLLFPTRPVSTAMAPPFASPPPWPTTSSSACAVATDLSPLTLR